MGKLLQYISVFSIFFIFLSGFYTAVGQEKSGDIVFYENFENGIPEGWAQEIIEESGGWSADWRTDKGTGWISGSIYGDPDTAAVGNKNLVFQFQGLGAVTDLITKPVDLEFIVFPELSFYHAQNPWIFYTTDQFGLYIKEGENGEWVLLRQYNQPVNSWTHRVFNLPSGSDSVYFRLRGTSLNGMGICIDEFTIIETGILERELSWVETSQALTRFVSSGSRNNPILKSQFRVTGNTGDLKLQTFTVKSLNTNDSDIAPNGIKLYFTDEEYFNTQNLIATANEFVNGQIIFSNIDLTLPTGYSYVWVSFDLDDDAEQGNHADAYIPANGISITGVNNYTVPDVDQNPPGYREIYRTIFSDDFEYDKAWELTGEWEIDEPTGLGGTSGFPGPTIPFTGSRILGTDLTGLGDFQGDVEPNIDTLAYQAISPEIDCFYYTNVIVSFQEWLNTEPNDKGYLHISGDGGTTWQKIWESSLLHNTTDWNLRTIDLPGANRMENVKIRFGMGPTDGIDIYSGWNIDNLVVTGTYVTRDVGVAEWIGPDGSCGMTNNEKITVRIKNYGAGPITGPIPVKFSLNNGQTWHSDVVNQNIPLDGSVIHTFAPGADFSAAGRYNNIIVKTELDGDQDTNNDALHHKLLSVPTYTPPYTQDFINNDGLWTGYGQNSSWMRGIPQGTNISGAYKGLHAWVTNAVGPYNSNEASWLESPCFNLTALENPVLEFHLNYHTTPGMDGVSVQYSLDQGENWNQVGLLDQNFAWNWYGLGTIIKLDEEFGQPHGWHGTSSGWKRVRAVLDDQVAHKEQVKFRLIFASDDYPPGANPWEGVAFDAVSVYQAPHDVGVTALMSPFNTCELSTEESVTIMIENHGFNTIDAGTTIPVGIDINELSPVYEDKVLDTDLAPGATTTYTFETKFDFSEEKNHVLIAYTILPGDNDFYYPGIYNDTLFSNINVYGYPVPDLPDTIYTTTPLTTELDAGSEFVSFLWQDGFTGQVYQITNPFNALYHVQITDQNGCPGEGYIKVITQDVEILEIIGPVESCELSAEEPIGVKIRNNGPADLEIGHSIPMVVTNHGEIVFEEDIVFSNILLAGEVLDYLFTQTMDMEGVAEYDLVVFQKYRDAVSTNDTAQLVLTVHGLPDVFIPSFIVTDFPGEVVLDPGAGYTTYLWHNGSTSQSFQVETWGEYWVEVTNDFGCMSKAYSKVVPELFDLAVAEIVSPADFCSNSGEQTVEILIHNSGHSVIPSGTSFTIGFIVEGDRFLEEEFTLQSPLDMDDTRIFTMNDTWAGAESGYYKLDADIDFLLDEVPENNLVSKFIDVYDIPQPFIGEDIYTLEPDTLVLQTSHAFESYLWQDGSSDAQYQVFSSNSSTYSVTVTDGNQCSATATVKVITYDLQMHQILSPKDFCEFTSQEVIHLQLMNEGVDDLAAGEVISLGFRQDNQPDINQDFVLSGVWASNTTRDFLFTATADLSQHNSFNLMAYVDSRNANPLTDTLRTWVELKEKPVMSLGGDIYTTKLDTVVLDAGSGFASYLWHDGFTDQHYSVASYGWKWVTVHDQYGCMTGDTIFVGQFVNIDDMDLMTVNTRIYPNPARDYLNIHLEGLPYDELYLEIYDSRGVLVYRENNHVKSYPLKRVDVSYLQSGTYFLKIRTRNYIKTHVFTKIN